MGENANLREGCSGSRVASSIRGIEVKRQITHRNILLLSCAANFLVGTYVSSIGPLLLPISRSFQLPISQLALPVSLRSAGFLAACIAVSALWRVKRARVLLGASVAIFFASLLLLSLGTQHLVFVLSLFVTGGIGLGISMAGFNSFISEISSYRTRAKNLSLLSVFFGIGAVIGPLLVAVLLGQGAQWPAFYLVLACGAGVLLVLVSRKHLFEVILPGDQQVHHSTGSSVPMRHASFWIVAIAYLFVVSSQVCFFSLAPAFLSEVRGLTELLGSLSISLFWVSMVIGGLLYFYVLSRGNLVLMVLVGAGGTAAFTFIAALSHQPWPILLMIACSGLFYSYLVPALISLVSTLFPLRIGSATGGLMATGGMGNIVFPFVISLMAGSIGFEYSFLIIPVLSLFSLIMVSVFRKTLSG